MHFQTHDNVATVSHCLTTVSICVRSSIDSEPRFHVSLILTATILPSGHSSMFSNGSTDSDIWHALITHSLPMCVESAIDSELL